MTMFYMPNSYDMKDSKICNYIEVSQFDGTFTCGRLIAKGTNWISVDKNYSGSFVRIPFKAIYKVETYE